ncbi:aminotransferase class V-fold PLP-dependent enzyme [Bacillus marinisedimentorum]|uniref:aminotransferase class V-fold PLP-dependent enzyme n=1 Tax=Bacillus marinisedimentorum TaxID=1821260 RepID=UPI0008725096|nr:aminotransferase class V-fold PLP-dependent enzyme [Bacillus marinisedimentorum]
MIYFDHAASSFPKPEPVVKAVEEALLHYAANPGRGSHQLAAGASKKIYKARVKLASFFGLSDPKRVLFFQNATGALNQALKGFPFQKGDHVLSTSFEHNSVRRPLEFLKQQSGIDATFLHISSEGVFEPDKWEQALRPETKLITVTHASNLTGTILPLEEISEFARSHGVKLLVDASQTAGVLPIHMEKMGIDMLAFPGHKGLLGPQGTGALLVSKGNDLYPIFHGGTGSFSESIEQPEQWPERFESGTLNTPGILGLAAGVDAVKEHGLEQIRKHEQQLTGQFIEGVKDIPGVELYGKNTSGGRLGVISFSINGADCHEVAMILDMHYEMAVRAGLHCAPLAHEAIGTITTGAVRVSFGHTNTEKEVEQLVRAITEIAAGYNG